MATVKPVILTSSDQLKKDGTTSIKIRVTVKSKPAYIDTNIYTLPATFDKHTGRVTSKHPNAKKVNARISELVSQCENMLLDFDADSMSHIAVRDRLEKGLNITHSVGRRSERVYFSDYMERLEKELELKGEKNKGKKSTASWHRYALLALRRAVGRNDISFGEVTASFLNEVEKSWREGATRIVNGKEVRVPMRDGGIGNYMRAIRSAWNQAEKELNDDNGNGPVVGNPWKRYSIPKTDESESKEKALTVDQLRRLIALKLDDKNQVGRARNTLLLSFCLVGMSTVDLYNFGEADGDVYSYERTKLVKKRNIEIKIEPEAQRYMELLKGENNTLNLREHYTSDHRCMGRNLRKCCKMLAKEIGAPADFSPQWMRHTWASIARNECRVNMDDVSFCMGHKTRDKRVTDVYLKDDHSLRHEINRKVLDYVFYSFDIATL